MGHPQLHGTSMAPWDTHSPMGILLLIPIFQSLHLNPQSVPVPISRPWPCPFYLAPCTSPCHLHSHPVPVPFPIPVPTSVPRPHLPSLSLSSSLSPNP